MKINLLKNYEVAEDSDGKLYLLHRGRIGGGRLVLGKDKFQNEFDGKWVSVEDGTNTSKLDLVAAFENSSFTEDVADFVHKVERIEENMNGNAQDEVSLKRPRL